METVEFARALYAGFAQAGVQCSLDGTTLVLGELRYEVRRTFRRRLYVGSQLISHPERRDAVARAMSLVIQEMPTRLADAKRRKSYETQIKRWKRATTLASSVGARSGDGSGIRFDGGPNFSEALIVLVAVCSMPNASQDAVLLARTLFLEPDDYTLRHILADACEEAGAEDVLLEYLRGKDA